MIPRIVRPATDRTILSHFRGTSEARRVRGIRARYVSPSLQHPGPRPTPGLRVQVSGFRLVVPTRPSTCVRTVLQAVSRTSGSGRGTAASVTHSAKRSGRARPGRRGDRATGHVSTNGHAASLSHPSIVATGTRTVGPLGTIRFQRPVGYPRILFSTVAACDGSRDVGWRQRQTAGTRRSRRP